VCWPLRADGEVSGSLIRERCEGVILDAPRGTHGFGYDPLFFVPPLSSESLSGVVG